MKHNDKPQDVVEMDFDRLTLVMGEKGGKYHAPMNPAATIVAVKGAQVEKPKEGGAVRAALKALGFIKDDASKAADINGIVEDATDRAKRNALYDLIYSLEGDVWSIVGADLFDKDARIAAFNSAIDNFSASFIELAGEVFAEKALTLEQAVKAGARHNAQDKADIEKTHDKIGKALKTLQAAHEATGRLMADSNSATTTTSTEAQTTASKGGVPGTVPNPQENEVDEATKAALVAEVAKTVAPQIADAVKSAVAEAVKAVQTPAPAAAPETTTQPTDATKAAEAAQATTGTVDVAAAIKAAFAEAVPQITEAAKKAATEAVDAKLADAAKSARENAGTPGGHEVGENATKSQAELEKEAATKSFSGAVATLLQTKTQAAAAA